jgi:hypothetical protein
MDDSNNNSDNEDMFMTEDSNSGPDNEELNISDLAAHTAHFNDNEQNE